MTDVNKKPFKTPNNNNRNNPTTEPLLEDKNISKNPLNKSDTTNVVETEQQPAIKKPHPEIIEFFKSKLSDEPSVKTSPLYDEDGDKEKTKPPPQPSSDGEEDAAEADTSAADEDDGIDDRMLLSELFDLVEADISTYKDRVKDLFGIGTPSHATSLLRLYRFLIGNNRNVLATSKVFKQYLEFRIDHSVDKIFADVEKKTFDDFPNLQLIKRYLPVNLLLRDQNGRPVFDKLDNPMSFERTGEADIIGLMHDVDEEIFMTLHIAHMEKRSQFLEAASLNAKRIRKFLLVKDFANLTKTICNPMYVSAINIVRKNLQISQDYYPATIEAVIMINAPFIFSTVFGLVSSVIRQSNEIIIDSSSDSLTDYIAGEAIPEEYGGFNKHELSRVHSFLENNPIPSDFVDVSAGKEISIPFGAVQKGDLINWSFSVDAGNSINFSVEIRTSETGSSPDEHENTSDLPERIYLHIPRFLTRSYSSIVVSEENVKIVKNDTNNSKTEESLNGRKEGGENEDDLKRRQEEREKIAEVERKERASQILSGPINIVLNFSNTSSWMRGRKIFYECKVGS